MKIEVSVGEAIDKFSILELKMKKIGDENKKVEIKKEIEKLSECILYKNEYSFLYNLLTYVNESIWDMTNEIKNKTIEDPHFAFISNQIFEFNQKRFRIKNWFNLLIDSLLKEQKSYSSTYCKIVIENEETIYNKIAEIHFLSLEYDYIYFETPYFDVIQRIFTIPTFLYEVDISNNIQPIFLEQYVIEDSIRHIFELPPIKYLMGGLFGDFIQTLSVINEKFYTTGRKGIIYLSDRGDNFTGGVENTYEDTHLIITKQNYIHSYVIYDNQEYDIDLTSWRNELDTILSINPEINWFDIFKSNYNINWGKHKWLTIQKEDCFKDIVFINTTNYRWPVSTNFKLLYETYSNNLVFIGYVNQYLYFTKATGINVQFLECNTFDKLCTAISSCKLFMGSLSGPLSLAHACHKDRIIGLNNDNNDRQLNSNLDKEWKNVRYTV